MTTPPLPDLHQIEDELHLYYQPTVSARDGRVVGMEALVRWQPPGQAIIPPGDFLPAAEQSGLAGLIGTWVLQTAITQARAWFDSGFDLFIAVNISTAQLQEPEFVEQLLGMLHSGKVARERIVLELNESTLKRTPHSTRNVANALRHEGVRLSLDHFGTGESSLSALMHTPADMLKIDRSFIANAAEGGRESAIVRAMMAMGQQLGMQVVANGVETEAQLGFLRRGECDLLQGYLFGKPVDADTAGALLRQRHVRPDLFTASEAAARTLLLVDDEDNVLRALTRLFRRDGYRILTANRVSDAFDLLATNDVQVIVSDQRMPDMNGTEFLGRVKQFYPATIRLILSGYADITTVTEAINRGSIYRFLTKPWDDEELREHIRQAFLAHAA